MDELKKSLEPIGMSYVADFINTLPQFIRSYIMEDFTEKLSIGFSNVPGSKRPWITNGSPTKSVGFMMPVGKKLAGSVSILSYTDSLQLGVQMDKSIGTDPKEILEIYYDCLDEMLGKEWRDFEKGKKTD